MIELLAGIFIKNKADTSDSKVRHAYGMLCGGVGIFLNIILFAGKFFAGLISNSIAITADAFNNLSDAGSSIITLIGFKMAGQEPDPDHPFGHGRIEYLTGLIVSFLIMLMGFELLKSSFGKILHPEKPEFSPVIVIILIASILVKLYMFIYNRRAGKRFDSAAMLATATDSISDTISTTVVLAATLVSYYTGLIIDGWCGLLVGIFICYAGFSAAKETISPLLGQAPSKEFVGEIYSIVLAHEEVVGVHDLIVHDYGPGRVIISLHAEVPADGDILVMHDVIDCIEMELKEKLKCLAVIHMDPVLVGDEETEKYKELVRECIAEIDPTITMHDFRIVSGPTHTNLIFDVVKPYKMKMTKDELTEAIFRKVNEQNSSLFTVINVDDTMI